MKTEQKLNSADLLLKIAQDYVAYELPDYAPLADSFKLEIRDIVERMAKQLVIQVRYPTEPLKTFEATAHFEVPATWWQMWKRDHAPEWLKNRWPIKYQTLSKKIQVEMSAVFPKLPRVIPNYGSEIRYRYIEPFTN